MITINLKPGSKRAAAGASLAGGLDRLKSLPGKIRDPWPMAAVGITVLTLGFLAWTGIGSASRIHSLEGDLATARTENRRFRSFMIEKRKAESARDSVVNQIATIRAVDGDRYVWPHILDEVTRAVPSYVWLTELTTLTSAAVTDSTAIGPAQVSIQMLGRAMDIQNFTRFVWQLEDSPWLANVTVVATSTVIDKGRAVTAFTVKADYDRREPVAPATPAAPAEAPAAPPPAGER
jgi:Tfp pilus assembly protein PilN